MFLGSVVLHLFCKQIYATCNVISHINPLKTELNPICHLLALLGGATIIVVSRLRVKYVVYFYISPF